MLSEDSVYHGWREGRHAIPLTLFLAAARAAGVSDEVVVHSIRRFSQAGGHRISLPERINEDLAYFAGLIAGDGSVERGTRNGVSIRFNNSNPVVIRIYTELVQSLFGARTDFTPRSSLRAATVRFHSRLVASLLAELGVPFSPKSDRLQLPGVLLNGPTSNLAAYLRGLYDTDGTIHIRQGGDTCVSLTTASEALASGVKFALLRFGIHASLRVRRVAGRTSTRADGKSIVTRHDQFVLDIRDWASIVRFREDIGMNHPQKHATLERIDARRPHSNLDLISGAGPHLREVRMLMAISPSQAYGAHQGGGLALEYGEMAATRESLLSHASGLEAAYRGGAYDGVRIRLRSDLRRRILKAIRAAGITGVGVANALGLPPHRVHDAFYRRSRRPPRIPVRVLERLAKLLGQHEGEVAPELEAEIAPFLSRIEKIPRRIEFLRLLASGDIRWEPVKEVSVRSSFPRETVFDLTVKDAHAFVANGILVHNTAAAVRDEFGEGRWTLEAGALVLADLGLACIDELEKMNPQDRSAIHEAMEQQRVSVAKAGITAVLQARCAVLAAANPKFGRFDETKFVSEQLDLAPTLLSRFDAIFSLMDRPESERDRNMADHILRGHLVGEWLRRKREGKEVSEEKPEFTDPYTPHFEPIFFRKYVAYAKRVSPVMTPDAMEAIKAKYLEIRKAGEPAGSSVPITPRQLEAIIRLSEASARARLSASVAVEDTDRAVRITEDWMRRVAGEEGRFDMDIIQTGISQSQRDQIITLRDVINQLSEQSPSGSADYEDIVRAAGERGGPPGRSSSSPISGSPRSGTSWGRRRSRSWRGAGSSRRTESSGSTASRTPSSA